MSIQPVHLMETRTAFRNTVIPVCGHCTVSEITGSFPLRHFCGCHHYEKACQLDWQREARHFSSPKQTDTVAGSRKQPQLLPDRLDARRATRLCCHTHTHHTHKSIGPLSASSTRPDRVSLSACHSFSRHDTRLSNADSLPGVRRWTCAGVSSFSSFLETAHDNLG